MTGVRTRWAWARYPTSKVQVQSGTPRNLRLSGCPGEVWSGVAKIFRLLLLLALTLGWFGGPCLPATLCGSAKKGNGCGSCCTTPSADCCAKSTAPAHQPPQIATASVDLKQALAPVLFRLRFQPEMPVPLAVAGQPIQAQRSVVRRVDVTCIRLI